VGASFFLHGTALHQHLGNPLEGCVDELAKGESIQRAVSGRSGGLPTPSGSGPRKGITDCP